MRTTPHRAGQVGDDVEEDRRDDREHEAGSPRTRTSRVPAPPAVPRRDGEEPTRLNGGVDRRSAGRGPCRGDRRRQGRRRRRSGRVRRVGVGEHLDRPVRVQPGDRDGPGRRSPDRPTGATSGPAGELEAVPVSPSIAADTNPGAARADDDSATASGNSSGMWAPSSWSNSRMTTRIVGLSSRRRERGVQVAEVVVAGQDDHAGRLDVGLPQDPRQPRVADDQADARPGQPLVGRRSVGPIATTVLVAIRSSSIVRRPRWSSAADDDVAGSADGLRRGRRGLGHPRSLGAGRTLGTLSRMTCPDGCGIIPASWARSSMAEQVTLNHWVEGSSPSGLTTTPTRCAPSVGRRGVLISGSVRVGCRSVFSRS